MEKFETISMSIQGIIGNIRTGQIAIPEIQRPFVWDTSKVRDLIDSLYQGYPTGYIITWRNSDVRLKDGSMAQGKSVIIDGQQRITAISAALVGLEVLDKNYKKKRIKIAFNPKTDKFEVATPAYERSNEWISDISEIIDPNVKYLQKIRDYLSKNPDVSEDDIDSKLRNLKNILNNSLGVIELSSELELDRVNEIFTRINSKGIVLSSADFVMSKIASSEKLDGVNIRKTIDYFCHLLENSADFPNISNDKEFAKTEWASKIAWVKDNRIRSYVPKYEDILRIVLQLQFQRGKMQEFVQLLDGRDFEKRINTKELEGKAFDDLKAGLMLVINKNNFEDFQMLLQSMGIKNYNLVRSSITLNFGFGLMMFLKQQKIEKAKRDKIVRRWIMLSLLTSRYSGSGETQITYDIKRFSESEPEVYLAQVERENLQEVFWTDTIIRRLTTPIAGPMLNLFRIAQIANKAKSFLSDKVTVEAIMDGHGDIHHIMPKQYLKDNGISNKNNYNQIANYAMVEKETNILIGKLKPENYLEKLGWVIDSPQVIENFKENAVPLDLFRWDYQDFEEFLSKRRELMAAYIKDYYFGL